MISHQHPSVHTPTCFFTDIGKALQKNAGLDRPKKSPPAGSLEPSHDKKLLQIPIEYSAPCRELQQTQTTSATDGWKKMNTDPYFYFCPYFCPLFLRTKLRK